jgi:hypothetical protein
MTCSILADARSRRRSNSDWIAYSQLLGDARSDHNDSSVSVKFLLFGQIQREEPLAAAPRVAP